MCPPSSRRTSSARSWRSGRSARAAPTARTSPTTRPAHPGRSRARDGLPRGRRGGALQRGPRLHPAAHHAPCGAAGPGARDRGLPARPMRARDRRDGSGLPRARARARQRAHLGRGRGAGLHARPGRAAPGRGDPPRARRADLVGQPRGGLPAPRHLRLPLRAHPGAARGAGAGRGRRGLRGLMDRARTVARAGGVGRAAPGTSGCRTSPAQPGSPPASWATRRSRPTRSSAPSRARTAGCWPSWPRARSTPRAEGRCPTRASSRPRRAWRAWPGSTAWATTRRSRARARGGRLAPGEPARASVDRFARLATQANHTATHLLHAALRERLGTHVRQAGSYVGPDKLRFDFTHGERLSLAEVRDVEDLVNRWIVESHPVSAVETTRAEAEALGAMALSARSTASACGWSRSRRCRGSSAAAPTSARRPRSASST